MFTVSKMRFSHIRLQEEGEERVENRNRRSRRNGKRKEVEMGGCGREEINEGLSGGEEKQETFTHN